MARPRRPARNITSQSWCADVRRFPPLINTDDVFGTHRPRLQSMFLVWFSSRENFERRATSGYRLAKTDFCHLFQLSESLFAVDTIRHSFTNIFFASGLKLSVTLYIGHGSLRSSPLRE